LAWFKHLALSRGETKPFTTWSTAVSQRLAISESVFSDFNGLQRHLRAIPALPPKPSLARDPPKNAEGLSNF
jgi:hypothetical protein